MKHLLCIFVMIVVVFTACDQGSEMLKPVIQEVMADDTPVVPTAEDTTVYSQYDVNQDGNVDNTDLTLISTAIGQKQPTNPRLDVDGNGIVDGADIILVSNNSDGLTPDTEDTSIPEIVFNPEPPTREESADFQPLDTDRVFHEEADYLTNALIFDDAISASQDMRVKDIFTGFEDWIREWCGKAVQEIQDSQSGILFTNRQARVNFLLALPGKYQSHGGLEHTDNEGIRDDSIFSIIGYVIIVEGAPYFGMSLDLNDRVACEQ